MAETSKNKIYYNYDEDSIADVLEDEKKIAESVDSAIEKVNLKDTQQDADIEEIQQKDIEQDTKISVLETDNTTNKSDISEIKQDISDINSKELEQDTKINTLEQDNTTNKQNIVNLQNSDETIYEKLDEKEKEIAKLKNDLDNVLIPATTEQAESLHVEDSAEYDAKLSIAGNSEQESREGYNLLENKGITSIVNGITFTKENDDTVTANGTATNLSYYNLESGYIDYTAKTYKVSGCPIGGSLTTYRIKVTKEDGSPLVSDIGNGASFTLTETTKLKIQILIASGISVNNLLFKPMIVEGETDKPYEQYGASPSQEFPSEIKSCGDSGTINEVVCNKNLFDVWESGSLFNDTGGEYADLAYIRTKFIKVNNNIVISNEDNTKSLYYKNMKGNNAICYYDYNKNYLGRLFLGVEAFPYKTNFPEKTAYIRLKSLFLGLNILSSELDDVPKLQIEQGSTATDYVEHQEQLITMPTQQPFRSIGDVRDRFVKIDGVWKEEHNIAEYIFDGTEKWAKSGNIYPTFYFNITLNITGYTDASLNALNNYFKGYSNIWYNNVIGFDIANAISKEFACRFNLSSSSNINTVDEWKTYISNLYSKGNPLKSYFTIAVPTYIDCTEEQSKILDKLEEIKTYKNVTNIYSTDEISSIVQLDYKKDLETLDKQKDDRITALEQLLSTTATSAVLLDNMQIDLESEVI